MSDRTKMILIGFLFAAVVFTAMAFADEPAAPGVPKDPPQASFGVTQCGEVIVVWAVTKEGKLYRMDAENHPDNPKGYAALLKWLASGPQDVYSIPCPTAASGGGRTHKQEKG